MPASLACLLETRGTNHITLVLQPEERHVESFPRPPCPPFGSIALSLSLHLSLSLLYVSYCFQRETYLRIRTVAPTSPLSQSPAFLHILYSRNHSFVRSFLFVNRPPFLFYEILHTIRSAASRCLLSLTTIITVAPSAAVNVSRSPRPFDVPSVVSFVSLSTRRRAVSSASYCSVRRGVFGTYRRLRSLRVCVG